MYHAATNFFNVYNSCICIANKPKLCIKCTSFSERVTDCLQRPYQ